jgi:uncharacterized protein (DUF983 family)
VPSRPTGPSPGRMLARAAARHCPVCGSGRLFPRWFAMVESCPRCHLRFERSEGHWIGALGMNTIVTFGLLAAVVVGGLILSYPEFDVAPVLIAGAAVALLFPLAFFPFARTLWTAVDLWMRPLEPGEADPPGTPANPSAPAP